MIVGSKRLSADEFGLSHAKVRRREGGTIIAAVLIGLAACMARNVRAHDSPIHVIEAINERVAKEGATAALLTQRATEYRAMGEETQAAKDLNAALALDSNFIPALCSLGRVNLSLGKRDEAAECVAKGLALAKADYQKAELYMTRSELREAARDMQGALEDCLHSVSFDRGDVDAALRLSRLQARLGLGKERIESLERALVDSGGGVLEIELIEAMIDAGRFAAALEKIEPQLRDSRFQASWLIRRARAKQGLGDKEGATHDLQAAIQELDTRISTLNPDVTLIADRGLANALLGNIEKAKSDLVLAKSLRADGWVTERLEGVLR